MNTARRQAPDVRAAHPTPPPDGPRIHAAGVQAPPTGMHMREVLEAEQGRGGRPGKAQGASRLLQGVVNRHRRLSARKWLAAFGGGLWVGVAAGLRVVKAVAQVEHGSLGVDLGEVVEVVLGWG